MATNVNGKKKKSTKMDSNGRSIKSKKGKNPRTPPKMYKNSGSQGAMSHGPTSTYNPVSKTITNGTGSKSITAIVSKNGTKSTTPKSKGLRFDQPSGNTSSSSSSSSTKQQYAMNVPTISLHSNDPTPSPHPNASNNTINGDRLNLNGDEIPNITFKKPSISLRNLLNNNASKALYRSNSTPASPTPKSKNSNNINSNNAKGSYDSVTNYNAAMQTMTMQQRQRMQHMPHHIHLKRRKPKNMNNGGISNGRNSNNDDTKAARPTFQFKIGMQVGVALGDCFLQLQKLENSMDKLRNVSEDITDVMQCIEQIGGTEELKQRAVRRGSIADKNDKPKDVMEEEDPIEEVHVLNDNLLKWQKDATKRMKNVSVTVTKLQGKLEDLDEYHAQAQHMLSRQELKDKTEIDQAMDIIKKLQEEVQKTKMELSQKNLVMQQLKKSTSEPSNNELIRQKLDKLESKEKELDRDAEIIATQSEELRKESERLLTERDEVRKQKEQWQKMIDEVKEQKAKLEKRESELQANHKKLLELHETLSEEKKKLHKKAKKIKAREKRLNALRAAQSQYVQQQNQYQVPSSNGSDYAESELTYFSDGDTEIASVNSISDDESQDNYHKQQLKAIAHLGVPQNPMGY